EAFCESVTTFASGTERTRDMFLAILGHDLRGPLHAVLLTAHQLSRASVDDANRKKVAARLHRSAVKMTAMVDDLLEFARTQLGEGLPVTLAPGDLGVICASACDDASAAKPLARI